MSRTKSAFLGSVSSHAFMVLNMLLSIVVTPFILRYLTKEEYGFYIIIFQVIGYLSILDLGLGGAITHSLASNRGTDEASKLAVNKIISTSFFTYSLLGLVVIGLSVLFAPQVPRYFNMQPELKDIALPITLTLGVFIGLQFPMKVFSSIFYAHQRQLLSNIVGFSITFLTTVLPVILLYLGHGLWSFIYTNIICSITSICLTFTLLRKYYPYLKITRSHFDTSLLAHLFNFGLFFFLGSIAYQIVFFTDRFFIGSFVSLTAATMYTLSTKGPDILRELIFKITDNALPAMVEIGSKDGANKSKEIHQKLLTITVCLSCIAFWLMYILNQWFVLLWVGSQYFVGQSILLLGLIVMVQHTILHVSSLSLYGIGSIKGTGMIQLLEAILNLALTLWLGKIYGIKGVLLATIIAAWMSVMWFIPYTTMKKLNITFSEYIFRPLLLPIAAISGAGMILDFLTQQFFAALQVTWVNFGLISGLIGAILFACAWMFFLRRELSDYIPPKFKKFLFC